MATKLKPGMYCTNCAKPVAAQKSTSRIRNAFAIGTSVTTAGASLLGAKHNQWHCGDCGGPVTKNTRRTAHTATSSAPTAASSAAVLDEIQRLNDLRQRGVLTNAEFQQYKSRLLASGSAS